MWISITISIQYILLPLGIVKHVISLNRENSMALFTIYQPN
jgi:hypothetical protein